jgi:rhomboid-related protein 1/2/3
MLWSLLVRGWAVPCDPPASRRVVPTSAPAGLETTDSPRRYLYRHVPWFVLGTSLAQVAVFVWYASDRKISWTQPVAGPDACVMAVSSRPPECADLRGQVWRLACNQFVHKGVGHVLSNVLMFLLFGVPLEMAHGAWRVGLLFTTGVVYGNLSEISLRAGRRLVGSSGGVYCMLGVHATNLYLNWSEIPARWFRVVLLGSLAVADLVHYGVLYQSGVGYAAHAGGYAFGVLGSALVLRNVRWRFHEKVVAAVLGTIHATWTTLLLVWYVAKIYPRRGLLEDTSYACE